VIVGDRPGDRRGAVAISARFPVVFRSLGAIALQERNPGLENVKSFRENPPGGPASGAGDRPGIEVPLSGQMFWAVTKRDDGARSVLR
jgi:hypothetical protein